MSATLDGNITLAVARATNVMLRFFEPGPGDELFRACAVTDSSGNFTIYGIPPGTYDVGCKRQAGLSLWKESEEFTDNETTEIDFGLPWYGDVDDNDLVDGWDYAAVLAAYGKFGEAFIAGVRDNDWTLPECPTPPPAGGACYGYVIS